MPPWGWPFAISIHVYMYVHACVHTHACACVWDTPMPPDAPDTSHPPAPSPELQGAQNTKIQ